MKPTLNHPHPLRLLVHAALLGLASLFFWGYAQNSPKAAGATAAPPSHVPTVAEAGPRSPAAKSPASALAIPCVAPVDSNSSGMDVATSDQKAFGDKKYFWKKKDLHICFMDGDPKLQQRVTASANEWTKYASLVFHFDNAADADIRISFVGTGHWSLVGTEALKAPKIQKTMNLQITNATLDDELNRVVLHEFGHAIGLMHEHRQPGNPIRWNKPVVYAWYLDAQNWDSVMVDAQVINPYNSSTTVTNGYHPDSIMHYPILKGWTTDCFTVDWNRELAQTDKDFAKKWYPAGS